MEVGPKLPREIHDEYGNPWPPSALYLTPKQKKEGGGGEVSFPRLYFLYCLRSYLCVWTNRGAGRGASGIWAVKRAKQAKCPLTDPFKRPLVAFYEGRAGQVKALGGGGHRGSRRNRVPTGRPGGDAHPSA